jgi:hypothetical protein
MMMLRFTAPHVGEKILLVEFRKHGISRPTYLNWRGKCGGVSASEFKRINRLASVLMEGNISGGGGLEKLSCSITRNACETDILGSAAK